VDTVNVDSRAPAKPLFYMALREGGSTATNGRRPRSGRVSDRDPTTESDPERIPGDHILYYYLTLSMRILIRLDRL
jgi:hypothetical protein